MYHKTQTSEFCFWTIIIFYYIILLFRIYPYYYMDRYETIWTYYHIGIFINNILIQNIIQSVMFKRK